MQSSSQQNVLGVRWNAKQDQLIISLDALAKKDRCTSQPHQEDCHHCDWTYLQPVGFSLPVTIQLKKLMQELCKAKLGSDQALQGEVLNKWNKLAHD